MRVPKLTFLVAFIMAGLASFLAWGWLEKMDRAASIRPASIMVVTAARANAIAPHVAVKEQGLRGSLFEGAMEEAAKAVPVGYDQVRIQTSSPDAPPIIIVEFARGLRRSVYTVTREEW